MHFCFLIFCREFLKLLVYFYLSFLTDSGNQARTTQDFSLLFIFKKLLLNLKGGMEHLGLRNLF